MPVLAEASTVLTPLAVHRRPLVGGNEGLAV